MTTSGEPVYSDWAIPPGEGLLEEIEFRGISPQELAASLGLRVEAVNELIVGDRAITPDIAARLEITLGISAQLWLNLEARYRTILARQWKKTGGNKEDWTRWCYGRIIRQHREEDETPELATAQSGRPSPGTR